MFRLVIASVSLAALCLVSVAQAQTTSLSFDSLPTAQGWVYNTGRPSVPETSIFSIDAGALKQNSLGQSSNFIALYEKRDFADTSRPFVLALRARVLEEDNVEQSHFGFCFGFETGTKAYSIGIGTNIIKAPNGPILSSTIDNTQFHDYRYEGTPDGSYSLYVDDNLIATGSALAYNSSNRLFLGDGTTGTNARAEITRFTYTAVPAPSALITLLIGVVPGVGVLLRRRHRK